MDDKIIVGIPGPWTSRDDLVEALESTTPTRFLLGGEVLLDVQTGQVVVVEVCERDERMARAFSIAGAGRIPDEVLASVDEHRTVVYLLADPGIEGTLSILRSATALLDAGGSAVKVESAGVAHDAETWRHFTNRATPLAAYDAMVTLVHDEGGAYSCGMQNFGRPDAWASLPDPTKLARLITTFNQWQLLARPEIGEDAWFAANLDGPAFAMQLEPYGYEEDSTLNNRHGKWRLVDRSWPDLESPEVEGPLFLAIESDSDDVRRAGELARGTRARIHDHLLDPTDWGRTMVKVRLVDGEEEALLWLALDDVSDETFTGQLFEVPEEFERYQAGDLHERPWSDLEDWAIVRHGAVIGGFSLRVARTRIGESHRRWHELYTGLLAFEPIEGLLERYAPHLIPA